MDRGTWPATVLGVTKSDTTEQHILSLERNTLLSRSLKRDLDMLTVIK